MKNILEIHILEGVEQFVANINRGLDELKVDRAWLVEMDHICYRVETEERYRELLETLKQSAVLLGESPVMGRMIATFRFNEPLEVGGWRIPYLELPAPKQGSEYAEGLEHAEFVVLGGDLEVFQKHHEHLADKVSHKAMSKPLNPELGLKAAGISVKFHELSLGKVVKLERLL